MEMPPLSTRPTATEPASFPQFAQLPAELRRKIWRRALPRRTIHLRLKMDMNAWNWATEGDWWTHYLVTLDPFPVASPALLRVSAEARAEALHAYRRRLALDPATLQRCLETAAGGRDDNDDDGDGDGDGDGDNTAAGKDAQEDRPRRARTQLPDLLIRHMCAPAGMPGFNAHRDVLVWGGVRRWCGVGGAAGMGGSSNGGGGPTTAAVTVRALFEAACRAARHVVVEYDPRLDGPLRALARAVAGGGGPPGMAAAPRSLTLRTLAPEMRNREPYWCGDFREPYWCGDFRVVAAGPRGRAVVALPPPRRADAGPARKEVEKEEEEVEKEEEEEEKEGHGAEAAALLRRHHVVFLPSAPPVPEGGFVVLAVVTPAQLAAIVSRRHPTTMAVFMDSALAHTFVGTLTAAQTTDGGTRGPGAAVAPRPETTQSFHGFCDPDYGLP